MQESVESVAKAANHTATMQRKTEKKYPIIKLITAIYD